MKEEFIELALGSHQIVHGFDENNKEIVEKVTVKGFSKKLVAIARVKSVSKQFILTDYIEGRWIYWEYEGEYNEIRNKLLKE